MARLSPTATRIWGITAALGLVTTAAIVGLAQPVHAHGLFAESTPAGGGLSADMVVPWIVGGLIVVAIAAGVILLLTRRRDRS